MEPRSAVKCIETSMKTYIDQVKNAIEKIPNKNHNSNVSKTYWNAQLHFVIMMANLSEIVVLLENQPPVEERHTKS